MSNVKKIAAVGLSSLLMVAVAAPGLTQPYERGDDGRRGGEEHFRRDQAGPNLTSSYVDSLEWRINNAAQEGRISRYQARRLVSELRQIQGPAIYRVENGRASGQEIRRVSDVVSRIEAATQGGASYGRQDYHPRRY